jgi:hypothetical protein
LTTTVVFTLVFGICDILQTTQRLDLIIFLREPTLHQGWLENANSLSMTESLICYAMSQEPPLFV